MNKLTEKETQALALAALSARGRAYAPYSGFAVGAALLAEDGRVFIGCNIENAAFSPSMCAERVALAKGVSEGAGSFSAIAIAGGAVREGRLGYCPPCGVCRQTLREFCDPKEMRVILVALEESGQARIKQTSLEALLPDSFGPEFVTEKEE